MRASRAFGAGGRAPRSGSPCIGARVNLTKFAAAFPCVEGPDCPEVFGVLYCLEAKLRGADITKDHVAKPPKLGRSYGHPTGLNIHRERERERDT